MEIQHSNRRKRRAQAPDREEVHEIIELRGESRAATESSRAPGIKDVAQLAGVSIATVSNVVNATRGVRPQTARRVREAIAKLNYQPDQRARNIVMKDHAQMLGLLVSDIQNPYFPEVARVFQDQALLADYETLILNTQYDSHRTLGAIRRLVGLRVPGVAVITSEMDPAVRKTLLDYRISTVYYGNGNVGPYSSNIVVDYEIGIRQALEYLKGLGHRRIGFIGGTPGFLSSQIRRQAYLKWMHELLPDEEPLIVDADFSVSGGYLALSRMLVIQRPSAVVAASDPLAVGAIHCAHDRGIRVPGDLSVIGFGGTSVAELIHPPLTTISVSQREVGQTAWEALRAMFADESKQGREYPITTELVIRLSTGACPAQAAALKD